MDPFSVKVNQVLVSIYHSVMQVEEKMLTGSIQDLTIEELHILETIWSQQQQGCSVSDAAQAHQVTLPSMTVSIQKLEKKGYVEKRRCSTDGRVIQLFLTRKGDKVNAMHRYFHRQMVRSFLKDLDETQRLVLLQSMENMQAFLQRKLAQTASGKGN